MRPEMKFIDIFTSHYFLNIGRERDLVGATVPYLIEVVE
jgi:hypothetical protein